MGLDINGSIEALWGARSRDQDSPGAHWVFCADLAGLLNFTGPSPAFECLFGVGDRYGFTPVAANRGMPDDITPRTHQQTSTPIFGQTWITAAELKAVDWDEIAQPTPPGTRVSRYLRKPGQQLQFLENLDLDPEHLDDVGVPEDEKAEGLVDGTEWTHNDHLYRVEPIRRRHAVQPDHPWHWKPTLTIMGALGELYGDNNVRLVVWFDQ